MQDRMEEDRLNSLSREAQARLTSRERELHDYRAHTRRLATPVQKNGTFGPPIR